VIKELIPPNLLTDQNIKALIEAIEPEFEKVKQQIINVLIYPRIDELSEEVLDLLAYQFHRKKKPNQKINPATQIQRHKIRNRRSFKSIKSGRTNQRMV